jgi:cytochrome c-type biogenesis protein CcmH/NrfG
LPEAVTLAESAVQLAPLAQNYELLCQAHAKDGDIASASAALQKAIELDPGNPEYEKMLQQLGGGK